MVPYFGFVGIWKIVDCTPNDIDVNTKGIKGTMFELTEQNDVVWKVSENVTQIPFFKCNTYKAFLRECSIDKGIIRFCSDSNDIITPYSESRQNILINDGVCDLHCRNVEIFTPEDCLEVPFSFLPALQDGFFSDLTLKVNDKKFHVHTCILKLTAPKINWTSEDNPILKLPEDVVGAILHFLYGQCLPEGLDESDVKRILSAASEIPGLEPLVSMCHLYLRNVKLKKKILNLMSDMDRCASLLIEYFIPISRRGLGSDPEESCSAVKDSFREAAVAASKFLVICDLYEKLESELCKEDYCEMIGHGKKRIFIFMKKLKIFFKIVRSNFESLSPSHKLELAIYIVEEIEMIFDTISSVSSKVKIFLEMLLAETVKEKEKEKEQKCNTCSFELDKKIRMLECANKSIKNMLIHLQGKKEDMESMSNEDKTRSIVEYLTHLTNEYFPELDLWIEKFTIDIIREINETTPFQRYMRKKILEVNKWVKKLEWKKYFRSKLVEICDLVDRDEFTESLIAVGLLELSPSMYAEEVIEKESSQLPELKTKNGYCAPPPSRWNPFSDATLELLKTEEDADMVFEFINAEDSDANGNEKHCTMAAHRVILSSRCNWFRKALLSGMKESVDRKIQVYDTPPHFFSVFVEFLYSGQLDCTKLSFDHYTVLLQLSDQYELDCLKDVCECNMGHFLNDDCVIDLCCMADRYNAAVLKRYCAQYLSKRPSLMDGKQFQQLPKDLQAEMRDATSREKKIYISGQYIFEMPDSDSKSSSDYDYDNDNDYYCSSGWDSDYF